MSSSDYYWARQLIKGFGRMWFLIVPQEADTSGGGESLLGSVVNEIEGSLFPAGGGIVGKDFPEPNHVTTPQIILKAIEQNRQQLGIAPDEPIVREVQFSGLRINIEKKSALKAGVGNFPSLPVAFSIDYSRMENITIEFGANTRKKFIPTGFLSLLKDFLGGDDTKIPSGVNIDQETIVHQVLLTDQYSITFESVEEFDRKFEAALKQINLQTQGKIAFALDQTTKKRVTVSVKEGKDYLIALKDIDWDDF